MIFKMIVIVALFILALIIIMSIVEGRIKSKRNERIFYKIDKIETLTGGLAHDIGNSYKKINNKDE